VLDDLSAGHAEAIPAGVPFVHARTQNHDTVVEALAAHRIDAVMHFAAWLDVGASVQQPSAYYNNNVTGTLSLLDAMVTAGVNKFIFSSTCAVYGEPRAVPLVEDHPTEPISPYGATKLAVERALPHFARAHGFRWIALRYFNAAGAHPDGSIGEDHDPEIHLIPRAITAVGGGEPLTLFGEDYPTADGTCIRDYIHVCDLADAHVAALAVLEQRGVGASYNVGTGVGHSVREVLDTVGRVTGHAVPYRIGPRRDGDPAALFASSERAQRELGWQPRFADLETTVRHAWHWHRTRPHGYRTYLSAKT
jgi:UDP-glucose-4-epimerase GalE